MNKNYQYEDKFRLLHLFYSIWGFSLFIILLIIQFFILLPISLVAYLIGLDKDKRVVTNFIKVSCNAFFILFFVHRIKMTKNGVKAPVKGQKRIYVINHSSIYDVILMFLLPGPIKFLVKEKWVKAPLIGWMQNFAGNIILKEERDSTESLDICKNRLEQGVPIIIFPEGTRSEDGQIHRFHRGSFKLALDTESEIVPVILDVWDCVRPVGPPMIRDVKPYFTILKPIKYENFSHLSHFEISKVTRYLMLKEITRIRTVRKATERNYYRNDPKYAEADKKAIEEARECYEELIEKGIKLNDYEVTAP